MKSNSILKIFTFLIIIANSLSAQTPKIRIACIGNSITEGFGTNSSSSYPGQLALLLGNHYEVRNYGVGGRTMLKKGDYPYWKETQFLDAQDFDPAILIISLGTNDSRSQNWIYKNDFFPDYMDMIRQFRKNNRNPQIFVCFPVPVLKDNFGISNSIIHNEIIPLIDSVRKMAGAYLIDYYHTMPAADSLFSDGVHPTEAGYRIMAEIAFGAIAQSPSGIIRLCYLDKTEFEKWESVKLHWETTPGSKVTVNGFNVIGTGSMEVQPELTAVYTLIARGEVSDTSSLMVKYLPPGKIKSFTAYPPFLDRDYPDTSFLNWSAAKGSLVTLNNSAVETNGLLRVSPRVTATYKLKSMGELTDSAFVTIKVVSSDKINRAFGRSVTTSAGARNYSAASIVDGDTSTYWLSGTGSSHWIKIDLAKEYTINRVVINWGNTYARAYSLQTLNDAEQAELLYSTAEGDGASDDIYGISTKTRYLRLQCAAKNNADSGYAIKEIEVYGRPEPSTDVQETPLLPGKFYLGQNYPNPFNPATKIDFELAGGAFVSLKIFDITGREIAVLENSELKKGKYSRTFNAHNLSSGIYFYRINAGTFSSAKPMMLLK